jgi:hypothetical protein
VRVDERRDHQRSISLDDGDGAQRLVGDRGDHAVSHADPARTVDAAYRRRRDDEIERLSR